MKTVLDFFRPAMASLLKTERANHHTTPNRGKAKRFSDNNSLLQKESGDFPPRNHRVPFQLVERRAEYRYKRSEADRFYPVTQRDLNSICMEARRTGDRLLGSGCESFRIFKKK